MHKELNIESFESLHRQLEDATKQLMRLSSIPKSIDLYIEYVIVGDRDNEQLFEIFCELKGLDLLRSLYKLYPLEILNGLSMLLVNVNKPACLMYILSHPLLLELVEDSDPSHLQYYISMIKSLSLRLDKHKVALLFNQRLCRFPLAWESSRFYNHPEMLVRASTTSIILGLMKISDPVLVEYFSSFPFTLYYLNLACSINYKSKLIDKLLEKGEYSQVAPMLEDIKDTAMVMQDMLELGSEHINSIVINSMLVYVIKPLLGSFTQSEKGAFSINLALFLLLEFANTFNSCPQILEFICLSMFEIKINSGVLSKIKENSYMPLNFNQTFVNARWIDKYNSEINHYCKRVFKMDSTNFQPNSEFLQELGRIKDTIGIDLITREENKEFWLKATSSNSQQPNPIRQVLISFLKTKDDKMLQLITKVIILFTTDNKINPDLLLKCGLLLPTTHPKQFNDPANVASLEFFTQTFLSVTLSELPFSIETLNSIFWLLDETFTKQIFIGQKTSQITLLLSSFEKAVKDLKNIVKGKAGGYLVSKLEESFKYPCKKFTIVSPNLLIAHSDFIQQGEIKQLLINFYCLLGLRYKYVSKSKFKISFMNLPERYADKFQASSSQWRVGASIQLHNRSMIQCNNNGNSLMIVRDSQRFIVVKQTGQENQVMVKINRKHKNTEYTEPQNSDTIIQVCDQDRNLIIELQFQNQYMLRSTIERLKSEKQATVNQQLSFLNTYLQDCLNDLKFDS